MRWHWLLLLGLLGSYTQSASSQPDTLVFTNANVIDGSSGSVSMNRAVVVGDGHIIAIVAADAAPSGGVVHDLKGKYLLPGLIDAHVHVASTGQVRKALRTGITTVRSAGTGNYADIGLRELAKKGIIESPEILAAGYHVISHPSEALFINDPSLSDLWSGVRGADAYRRVTAANLERGVDWIKIASTERAGLPNTDPRKQTMTLDEIAAVVDEATNRGVPVAAHAHGDEGGRAAVLGGVRSIEHGTYLSEETLTLMKERGTFLVPTVAIVEDLMNPGGDYDDPVLRVRGRHMLPRVMEVVATARRLGVKIVAATDTGFRPDSTLTLQHEIEALTKCGMSPMEAIRAATSVAAELLEIDDRTGTIRQGYEADLIVVDQNPLENILSLQDVLLVVNNGKVVLDRLNFALE
ncbi:MAG: amidohydrolase family protein [Acidobacteriota bacterium]|nr:MAG: amidohydrolase family protein [Acidobacteriota bacterium]